MNISEESFTSVMSSLNFAKEHFDRVIDKMQSASQKSAKEIKALTTFLTSMHSISKIFEESLFKSCEEFQKKTKEFVKDEQITHSYQLLINSVLRFGDNVQKLNRSVNETQNTLLEMEKRVKVGQTSTFGLINASTNEFKSSFSQFEVDYRKYIKVMVSHTVAPKEENTVLTQSDLMLCKNTEETVLNSFGMVKSAFGNNLNCLKLRLDSLCIQENEGKKVAKEVSNEVTKTLRVLNKKEGQIKSENWVENSMDQNSYFEQIKKDLLLEFNNAFGFSHLQLNFCSYYNFLKLNAIFQGIYSRYLWTRIFAMGAKIPVRVKLYVELFFENFYRNNSEFTKEIIDELETILNEKATREYFVFCLIYKKSVYFYVKPFSTLAIKSVQFQNLQTISHLVLLAFFKETSWVDFETIFAFLKFALCMFNEQKGCLIEKCINVPQINTLDFWSGLFDYLLTQNSNGLINFRQDISNSSQFFNGIKNIVDNFKNQIIQPKQENKQKVFDELAFFLFKLKIDFEKITEILLMLANKGEILSESVRSILLQNQELLLGQISRLPEFKIIASPDFDKLTKLITKNHKLVSFLGLLVGYLNTAKEVQSVITLNKFVYSKSESILKQVLLQFHFSRNSKVRKHIISLKIDSKSAVSKLTEIDAKKDDTTIVLDVKRTFSFDKNFKSESLHLILSNISNEEVGCFAYYQGLNYIVTYFLGLFENDEILTYNFTISILYNNFSAFIDQDLKNIRKLFFYLKSFMKTHLPILHEFLENEQKLDSDIVVASWCLTLFTTVTQYTQYSPFLDEIIDIFLAKGWPGFFRVILVILEELQDKIFKMNYEDTLMMLGDLCKTNFREITQKYISKENGISGESFSFKIGIRKFKRVNKMMMMCYQFNFHKLEEKVDEFWYRINKKIKAQAK